MDRKDASDAGFYPFYVRSDDVMRSETFEYDEEAIVIPGEGRIGEIFHHVSGKYALHQRAYRIHFRTATISPKFAYYYFTVAFKTFILSKAVSATVTSIRKPMLEQFPLPVPPLEEQERIVAILDKFDALVNDLSTGLPAELRARRQQYEHYRDRLLTFSEAA
jgi:type I restriction enzyme S subunit